MTQILRCLLATLCIAMPLAGRQLPVRNYTSADGLAGNFVNQILEDSRGFLWLATSEGLSRFDGNQFTTIPPGRGRQLRTFRRRFGACRQRRPLDCGR